ncbi:hypothetical protein [Amycolatopsis magusensis]|uniref:AAA+ ATPase domain-containing protein n=1 Tax=Amycolatopsis magusensis TaxID=882444 RepID=A0ABS4Q155_9PSEU|nr:hypothetical protein [Amycolatopsis magusensis]MBP2184571.1 hypothetical protein [Amycolatopsis magusensis]
MSDGKPPAAAPQQTPPPQAPPPASAPAPGGGRPPAKDGSPQKGPDKGEKPQADDDTRAENDALILGDRFYSKKLSQYRPKASIKHAYINDLQVGDRYEIFVGHQVAHNSGSVREDVLEWVRKRYLPVDGHAEMARTLERRRLLVLRGEPGTGRVTTALHLLDQLAKGRVYRLDTGKNVKSLTSSAFPKRSAGYVAEVSRRVSRGLTEENLDGLRDRLEKASSYCVLVAEADSRRAEVFGGYAFEYVAPDPARLLAKHIEHEVTAEDSADVEAKLTLLQEAAWTSEALGPSPRPLESVRVAALLAQHARGEISQEKVEWEAAQAVHYQVAEWFVPLQGLAPGPELDDALRLGAFRVALAVLNKSPYTLVAEAAEILGDKFVDATGKDEKRRLSFFADDQASRLPGLRAKIIDGYATFGRTRFPMPLLQFHDPRYPTAILDHVWRTHQRMRAAIDSWLLDLGKDHRPMLWVRAAQATGYLCRSDFAHGYTKMISPNAMTNLSEEAAFTRRRSAAIALDQAARDDNLQPAIMERLQNWRRYGHRPLRWTAAATYGFTLGREHIDVALEELRVLGTPSETQVVFDDGEEWDVVGIAAHSVAKLLAFGKITEVLDRLRLWFDSDRSSLRRLALRSLRQLANLYGFELDYLEMSVEDERPVLPGGAQQWPLLLTLQWQDPRLTEPIAALLRKALRTREGDYLTRYLLARWVRSGEHDLALLVVLEDFLVHLVVNQSDAQRLTYLIDRLTKDWADPLRPEVADRLIAAIGSRNEMRVE